ncbi:MAG: hypothetical protein LBK13_05900, partial [Spirochaetales bacterium]|nr:hypothetical protein [Spirochaetales bacterium]
MQFLWAFRYYPGCMGEQQNCVCNFATSPLRRAAGEFAECKFATSQDAWASSKIAYAIAKRRG